MATTTVILNRSHVGAILKSASVLADLRRRANAVASAAGPGHAVDSQIGPHRARASVRTVSFSAMRREATTRNLTKSIQAAR